MKVEDVIQEILLRLVDIVMNGGKAQKIIVSEKVMNMLKGITLMPRSVQYIDSVFYIADVPVEMGDTSFGPDKDVWFRIV